MRPQPIIYFLLFQVCHLCQLRYSFLGQLEAVEEEKSLLLTLAFNDTRDAHVPQLHRKRKADSREQITHAYSNIPRDHIEVLRKYYQTDFDVFGYSTVIPGLEVWQRNI